MKKRLYIILFITITSIVLAGCNSTKKKMQASTSRDKQLKQDSIAARSQRNQSISSSTKSNDAVPRTKTIPPAAVSKKFRSSYPTATEIRWSEVESSSKTNDASDYKVTFLLRDNQNSIVYNENGKPVESKIQILPEQLPQNIYDAIVKKYPDAKILSASELKYSTKKYIVLILTEQTEKEVVLTETGTFVEY